MTRQAPGTVRLLDRVFSGLEDAEVRWALLRGRAGLGVAGRDVDLLVAADDVGAMEDLVFGLGGLALPKSLHPWHRFYVLEDPDTRDGVTLDVVTELIYNRRIHIASSLETACLDRRAKDGALYVLDPTDLFWTVMLHCVLDKEAVAERRRTELESVVQVVSRPSPGETFFASLCPPDWSADRALASVALGDWDALTGLGKQIATRIRPPAETAGGGTPLGSLVATPRRMVRTGARAIYPMVWRRAGLGVTPHILEVLDDVPVDATVVSLRRRPGICDVVLLVPDDERDRLNGRLREDHYRRVAGLWTRARQVGLERVQVLSPSELALPIPAWLEMRSLSSPMPGRTRCRRASAGTTLLVTAMSLSPGHALGGLAGQSQAPSSQAWAEAERLATAHGLVSRLEALTRGGVA